MSRMLAFTDATLVCPVAGVSRGGVLVEDDRIIATGVIEIPEGAEVIACGGHVLAPGAR